MRVLHRCDPRLVADFEKICGSEAARGAEGSSPDALQPCSPSGLPPPRDSQIFAPSVRKQARNSFRFNHLYFYFRSQCLASKSATPAGCLLIVGSAECNLTDEDSCILFISSTSCVGRFVNLVSVCHKGRD